MPLTTETKMHWHIEVSKELLFGGEALGQAGESILLVTGHRLDNLLLELFLQSFAVAAEDVLLLY